MPTRNSLSLRPDRPLSSAPLLPVAARPRRTNYPLRSLLAPAIAALGAWLAGCGASPRTPPPAPPPPPTEASVAPQPPPIEIAAAKPSDDPLAPIPAGWCAQGKPFATTQRAYCLQTEELTWAEARKRCEADGGKLAQPATNDESEALAGRLRGPFPVADFWIGLAQDERGQWSWEDGSSLGFSSWAPGEPNNYAGVEHCAEVYSGSGRWNDLACETPMPFVCKLGKPGSAQGGFKAFRCPGFAWKSGADEYCYHPQTVSWGEASALCAQSGGELASLRTEQEYQRLVGTYGSPLRAWRFWIGMSDQQHEGEWRWTDGQPVNYARWMAGEPNNAGASENCGEVLWDQWNDLPCDTRQASLCEAR